MNTLLRLFGLSTESERVRLSGLIDRLSFLRCDAVERMQMYRAKLDTSKRQAHKINDQRKYYADKATDLQLTVYQLESELRTQTTQNNAARNALLIATRERDLAWDNIERVQTILDGSNS